MFSCNAATNPEFRGLFSLRDALLDKVSFNLIGGYVAANEDRQISVRKAK